MGGACFRILLIRHTDGVGLSVSRAGRFESLGVFLTQPSIAPVNLQDIRLYNCSANLGALGKVYGHSVGIFL